MQEGLSAKGIVEAIPNHPFVIIETNLPTEQQRFDKREVLRGLNKDIPTIVSNEAPRKWSQFELSFSGVKSPVKTKRKSSVPTTQIKRETVWRELIFIHDNYLLYWEEFINMLTPFQSMWDEPLGWFPTVGFRVELQSDALRPVQSVVYRGNWKVRHFARSVTEKMLATNVMEPSQTGGPQQLFVHEKKPRTLCWPQKGQDGQYSNFESTAKARWMYRLAMQRYSILNFQWQ